MLEEKIRTVKSTILWGALISSLGCAPSMLVPVKYVTSEGVKNNGIECCNLLNCKGYDGCRNAGEQEYQNSVYFQKCECYDIYVASSSSSNDHGRIDREKSGGHAVCK